MFVSCVGVTLILLAMTTPILTKKQQKNSLSGKKKQRAKCLRNVLTKPKIFTNPVADDTVAENIFKALESNVHFAEKVSFTNITDEEQKSPKKKTREKIGRQGILKEKGLRKYLCLGVNEVARAIENGYLLSVLLEKDVDPQFMVSHIGTLCIVHNIPYIIVQGLRNGTHKTFGFSCISLGVKAVTDNEENPFTVIHQLIVEAFRTFPFNKASAEPLVYTPVSRVCKLAPKDVESIKLPKQPECNVKNILLADIPDSTDNLCVPEKKESIESSQNLACNLKNTVCDESVSTIYKYRVNTKERVFLPRQRELRTEEYISVAANVDKTLESMSSFRSFKGISANFSSLRTADLEKQIRPGSQVKTNEFGVEYKLHEIKRVQPNPDKRKKIKAKRIKKSKVKK